MLVIFLSNMVEKNDQIEGNGRLFELFLEKEVWTMLEKLVRSGTYDSEKEVIIQAIKNLHERTKARENGSKGEMSESLSTDLKQIYGFDFEERKKLYWNENKKIVRSPRYLLKILPEFSLPHLTEVEQEQDVKLEVFDEKLATQRQLYGSESIGLNWYFNNRILPVKLAAIVLIQKINKEENAWIELDELKKDFLTYVKQFDFIIRNVIDELKDIISTFPASSGDKNFERKEGRFAHTFVGKLVKKKENKLYDTSDGHYLTGALFEMGLIKAKRVVKKRWGKTMTGKSYKNITNIVYVSITELGLEFAGLNNPLLDFFDKVELAEDNQVYTYEWDNDAPIFSHEEQKFYLDKILPKFEFEHSFVDEMISIGRFEKSGDIKELFERQYLEWLKLNYPQDYQELTGKDDRKLSDFVRMRSLVIMSRLVELGIFVKEPGSKFGPYYLRDK